MALSYSFIIMKAPALLKSACRTKTSLLYAKAPPNRTAATINSMITVFLKRFCFFSGDSCAFFLLRRISTMTVIARMMAKTIAATMKRNDSSGINNMVVPPAHDCLFDYFTICGLFPQAEFTEDGTFRMTPAEGETIKGRIGGIYNGFCLPKRSAPWYSGCGHKANQSGFGGQT